MIVRTQSLAGEFVHVDELDPALDQEAPDWRQKYDRALELSDFTGLPLKNGGQPVVWRFRHLSADEVAWVVDRGVGNMTMNLDVLALALLGVIGVQDETGKPYVVARERDPQRAGFVATRREQLDALLRDPDGRLDNKRLGRLAGRVWADLVPPRG